MNININLTTRELDMIQDCIAWHILELKSVNPNDERLENLDWIWTKIEYLNILKEKRTYALT